MATTYDGTTSTSETTLYVGGLDIITDSSGTWYRHTISAYGKPVLLETLSNNTSGAPKEDKHYLLNDHLGSVDTVVRDSDGTVVPRESFDAFGQRRDKGTWYGAMNVTDLANARKVTHRGFTHHEHLDNLAGLVHANGRVLDSVTGRFLSVDPVYQAPRNSQSVNPYSYVMNNSLSLVDPSGYESAPAASPLANTVGQSSGGPQVNAASQTSSCSAGEGVSACAGSLQNGQTASITDGSGNVIGTVGKDSSGNLMVTAGNGSNFGQTSQFTSTISGNSVETSGGGVTVVGTFNHSNGAETNTDPSAAAHQPGGASDIGKQTTQPPDVSKMFVITGGYPSEQKEIADDLVAIAGTKRGGELMQEQDDRGTIVEIRINHDEIDNSKKVPGGPVNIDPTYHPEMWTAAGKAYVSTLRALAHEVGHAISGIGDTGPNNMDNVRRNENPIMEELAPNEADRVRY